MAGSGLGFHTTSHLRSVEVLNLPRVPWRIGMTTFSYFSDTVGLAAGEACGGIGGQLGSKGL